MRRLGWALLLTATFAIPWEYSLDLGPPFGNLARIAVIAIVLALIPALLQAGRIRTPGLLQVLIVTLLVWFCLSTFWSIDRAETLRHLRGYVQEFILVWLVWELVDLPGDLRNVLRAYVAGAGVLAALTVGTFFLSAGADRIRFAAAGQDPNDAARLLDLTFPLATLLFGSESRWPIRLLAAAYVPFGVLGVVLTASRSGFLDALIALTGSAILLFYSQRRAFFISLCAVPAVLAAVRFTIPLATLQRLATIPDELMRRDFNQRADIWAAGWQAFIHAPLLGDGAGSFVAAAELAPIDTAHNTALALLVEGGMVGFLIATAIGVLTVMCVLKLAGPLRIALGTALVTWTVGSLVATVHENRATWLLLGIIAAAARLHEEQPEALTHTFPLHLRASSTLLSAAVAQEQA